LCRNPPPPPRKQTITVSWCRKFTRHTMYASVV
jgi:hypothetical protein